MCSSDLSNLESETLGVPVDMIEGLGVGEIVEPKPKPKSEAEKPSLSDSKNSPDSASETATSASGPEDES